MGLSLTLCTRSAPQRHCQSTGALLGVFDGGRSAVIDDEHRGPTDTVGVEAMLRVLSRSSRILTEVYLRIDEVRTGPINRARDMQSHHSGVRGIDGSGTSGPQAGQRRHTPSTPGRGTPRAAGASTSVLHAIFPEASDMAFVAGRLASGVSAELLLLHVLVWEGNLKSLETAERADERASPIDLSRPRLAPC